jgi:hypothetical protein
VQALHLDVVKVLAVRRERQAGGALWSSLPNSAMSRSSMLPAPHQRRTVVRKVDEQLTLGGIRQGLHHVQRGVLHPSGSTNANVRASRPPESPVVPPCSRGSAAR